MGKNPAYLPRAVWTVAAMIDERFTITWHCEECGQTGLVNLARIAEAKGSDYSLVDKRAPCRRPGCTGAVYFRYAPGPGTPSRRLEALRERQETGSAQRSQDAVTEARRLYNETARRYGRPTIT